MLDKEKMNQDTSETPTNADSEYSSELYSEVSSKPEKGESTKENETSESSEIGST